MVCSRYSIRHRERLRPISRGGENNQKKFDDEWQERKLDYMDQYHECWWFEYRNLDNYVDPKKKPKSITAGIGHPQIEQTMKASYDHNKSVIQKLQEFIHVCGLLIRPENHIIKKSGQHVAKQVNVRTEQDMTNEMARKLTNLPKYTAYTKVLHGYRGRMETLCINRQSGVEIMPFPLRVRRTNRWQIIERTLESARIEYTKSREEIEREVKERHERLAGAREKEPPPVSAPASQEPMALGLFGDILTSRFARPRILPEDEPPPSRS